jgi:alanyl-tRNA synthetase
MHFREIRQIFLDYFKSNGHEIVASSSLVPRDDPTLLFTNAGMVQFKRTFLGEEPRTYSRAATSQKCVRAGGKHNDLENVGYTARHHTFFEMLGNFSFGDYFKREAIQWAWELLTGIYKLPAERLYASVYQNDDEACGIWEKIVGLPRERIVRLGDKDNFWAMGETGPCGPCSEILIDQGPGRGCGRPDCGPSCGCDRYLEIWNLVFTQFDRQPDGTLVPLPRPNIDTGMGLERLTAVIQGAGSNYDTDIFSGLMAALEELSGRRYGLKDKEKVAFRVIADHARAGAFLIGDGVMPSNEGRGYVLRRIIRRAIRFGQILGLKGPFLHAICDRVIEVMGPDYEELYRSRGFIQGLVLHEEKRFADTLHHGMRVLGEEIEALRRRGDGTISGEVIFKLYDTYGLSPDIVQDVARDEGLKLDLDGYEAAMSRQRGLSQESWKGSGEEAIPEVYRRLMARGVSARFTGYTECASEAAVVALLAKGKEIDRLPVGTSGEVILDRTPFYGEAGGQVGDTGWIACGRSRFRVDQTKKYAQELLVHAGQMESGDLSVGDRVAAAVDQDKRLATARNHSGTHLLHAALREILGEHVKQAGSLVSAERLRFDFSHFAQVPLETLHEIERLVNRHIRANLPVTTREMARDEAMKTGAMAIFEERYGDKVRLVHMGEDVSMELCGGTHIARTGDIGLLRIVGEGAVAANVRRIEALTGEAALIHDQEEERALREVAALLKIGPDQVAERVTRLLKEQKDKEREIEGLKNRLLSEKSQDILADVLEADGVKVVAREMEADSPKELRDAADRIRDRLQSGIVVLGTRKEGKAMLVCVVTKDLTHRFKAGEIIARLSGMVGGKGGGRADMAQGGGDRPDQLKPALDSVAALVRQKPADAR